MKIFYYKKMINGIQYSNVCLEISPIYEFNQESDPWDISYYPNDDLSLSGGFISKNDIEYIPLNFSKDKEILEDKKGLSNKGEEKDGQKDEQKDELKGEEKEEQKEEQEEEQIEDNEEEILDMDIFSELNKHNRPLPVPEKAKKECDEISHKSTDEKSKNNNIEINKCIFGVKTQKKIEPRIDYAIKNFKVYLSKYLKDYGNKLIKECNFKNKLKKMKLFSASYKYFTGNSNEKENKIYLNFTMEDIFTYPDKKVPKNDNRLQMQNKQMIQEFKEYINDTYDDDADIPEKIQKVQQFFKMTFDDAIKLFYDSKQFDDYSSSQKTRFLDEQFIKSKGFSLLEKNAFFKLMKNYKKTG